MSESTEPVTVRESMPLGYSLPKKCLYMLNKCLPWHYNTGNTTRPGMERKDLSGAVRATICTMLSSSNTFASV